MPTDFLDYYFKRIQKFGILTKEETHLLVKKAQNGSKKARDKVIRHHLKLVVYIAKRYHHTKVEWKDIIAEGNLGLFAAIKNFKPGKGSAFSTYSVFWIRNKIIRLMRRSNCLIRVPEYLQELQRKFDRAEIRLTAKTKRKLRNVAFSVCSLNYHINSDDGDYTELQDVLVGCVPDKRKVHIKIAIGNLKELHREILKRRSHGWTLQAIADDYDISRERVRQIEAEAIKKLKRFLTYV